VLVLGLILPTITGLSRADEKPKPVKLERTWRGEVKVELRKEAPEKGYVASKDAGAKLWMVYRGEEDLPEVDFDKELVLVAVGRDPNRILIEAKVDDKDHLKVTHSHTAVIYLKFKTCSY
jgi:hypothetical protein